MQSSAVCIYQTWSCCNLDDDGFVFLCIFGLISYFLPRIPDMYERARRSNGKFEGIIPSVCSGPGGWRPGGAWPGGGRRWGRRRLPGWSRGPPGTPGRLREGRGGFTWTISMPLVLSSKESILNGVLVGECFNRVASLDFSNIFSAWIAFLTPVFSVLLFWWPLMNWSWSCPRRWLPRFWRVLVCYWSTVVSSPSLIGRPITAQVSPAPVTAMLIWAGEAIWKFS